MRYRGEALPKVLPQPVPAVGSDFVVTVPGGVVWETLAFSYRFVASAVVGTRVVTLLIGDGTTTFGRISGITNVAAGGTVRVCYFKNYGYNISLQATDAANGMFPDLPLLAGYTVSSSTRSLDVGDRFLDLALHVIEYDNYSVAVSAEADAAWKRARSAPAYPAITG